MRKRALLCGFFAIPLILFNVLFFVIAGSVHPRSVWISFAWIQLAFVLLITTPWLSRRTENGPVYRITLALISGTYCLVEFVIGMVVIALHPETVKWPVVAQVIPFCIYLFALLGDLLFIEYAADSDERHAAKEKAGKAANAAQTEKEDKE